MSFLSNEVKFRLGLIRFLMSDKEASRLITVFTVKYDVKKYGFNSVLVRVSLSKSEERNFS